MSLDMPLLGVLYTSRRQPAGRYFCNPGRSSASSSGRCIVRAAGGHSCPPSRLLKNARLPLAQDR
jgi:hypothetical protein